MRWWRYPLVLCLLGMLAVPAPAGIFKRKPATKPNPARVPELLGTMLYDQDESKRIAAIVELRQYDAQTQAGAVPVLLQVLQKDAKPAVRAEAADSLTRIRPVSQEVGVALEQAVSKDASMRVRVQARYSLLQYHWAGYRKATPDAPTNAKTSAEPPLAQPVPTASTSWPSSYFQPKPVTPQRAAYSTPPPPLADPRMPVIPTSQTVPPGTNPLQPVPLSTTPPPLQAPPSAPKDQGPALDPAG